MKKEKVKVHDSISKSVEPFLILFELKNIEVNINVKDDVFVECDYNWTIEAIANIIKNAYEHTPQNGNLCIKSENNLLYTQIDIQDSGEGIKKDSISRI